MPDSATPAPSDSANDEVASEWRHALSVADTGDPKYVVSSPNMHYVPCPQVGVVKVSLRSDYRYGAVDPIQWPQIHTDEFYYLSAVLRPTPPGSYHAPLWWTPNQSTDFNLLEGSLFTCLGLIKPEALRPLSDLVDELSASVAAVSNPDHRLRLLAVSMTQARERLRYFPCTFRDAALQIRETQRYWLMTHAYLDFDEKYVSAYVGPPRPANRELMGAFTTDPGVVNNFLNAGIPVWFIRTDVSILQDTKTGAVVIPTAPDVCTDRGPEGDVVVYSGLAGADHMLHTCRFGHTYLDLSRVPLLVADIEGGYPAQCSQKEYKGVLVGGQRRAAPASTATPVVTSAHGGAMRPKMKPGQAKTPYTQPHKSQIRGVNKFEPLDHAWNPPQLGAWEEAFRSVDLSKPARPNAEIWGYWIPEPALLLRPKTQERRVRYIMTWLRLRAGWLYLLRLPDVPVTTVPTQWWRDVLYGPTGRADRDPSKLNSQRWDAVKQVFGTVFEQINFDSDPAGPIWWCGHRVSTADPNICPTIIWEMYDLGFRYELLALDRLFVPHRQDPHGETKRADLLASVFPDHHLYSVTELPAQAVGLCAVVPHRRVPYLEALRRVVARWPSCPASIHGASPFATSMSSDEIVTREKALVKFYVDTFFAQSGRAPIVPHEYIVVPDGDS